MINTNRAGDNQIVKVVVNNLLAQRRSRQRKAKQKPVLGIGSTSKPQHLCNQQADRAAES